VRALVAGAGGQLGRALQDCAPAGVTVIAPSEAEFDITDAATVARVIADSRVDVVFNAAAYTAVDKAEADAAPAQLHAAAAQRAAADAALSAPLAALNAAAAVLGLLPVADNVGEALASWVAEWRATRLATWPWPVPKPGTRLYNPAL
jgi:nucleoside-diphosphate-sugar epimerase